ncbi:recombinase [Desulfobacteraceae bacterium SEEP-SAG9]|nr:recombinase [Desulfobacteraceae bacterium SEEP-SAG9]
MDEYEIYESECKKIRKENRKILDGFRQYLGGKKISAKTIDKHASNIDFYINEFLLYEEPLKAKEGVSNLNSFMGYWFIRKAMWASVASIKENITSLKHFYTFMYDCNAIGLEELEDMKEEIKENKAEWLETVRKYNDPDTDFEDIW